jgi:hypothetical protein
MELAVEPDLYSPSIDNSGNYIDKIPSFISKRGIRCPCGSRKDKIYESYSIFSNHIKTKTHNKWLENLNLNKANYYTENIKLKELINNQKIIIAKLEKDINTKILTVDFLTKQLNDALNNSCKTVNDLLDY